MKNYLGIGILALALVACGSNKEVKHDVGEGPANGTEDRSYLNCRNDDGTISVGIVNGSQVGTQDPHSNLAVMLVMDHGRDEKGHYKGSTCTGTPISDRVILTAAHCVKDLKKTAVHAVFHNNIKCSSGYDPKTKMIPAIDVVINSEYKGKADAKDDLALVKLASPIPSHYPIATLYDGKSALSSDDVLMIGYGITSEMNNDHRVLRKTIKSFKKDSLVQDNNIVFDQRNSTGGVCSGDSGGPIYVQVDGQYQIVGINSVVTGASEYTACHEFSIALYAPFYNPWIQTELAKIK
ncbi:S1 family peptidase [Bdellovibrio sp. HCB337]|uniref:S1 family peptidase n=1 Tax=Bdellovibrio sp. HCB337 TaxID=3394358 RepID=UPI0039A61F6A